MPFRGKNTARATASRGLQGKKKKAAPRRAKAKRARVVKPKKAKPVQKTKTRKKIERKLESLAERKTLSTLRKLTRRDAASRVLTATKGALAIGALPAGKALASLGVAGSAAAVAIAFGIGYGIGTGGRALWRYLSKPERDYRRALAFRQGREDFERQTGRKPNAAEVREIGRAFLEGVKS